MFHKADNTSNINLLRKQQSYFSPKHFQPFQNNRHKSRKLCDSMQQFNCSQFPFIKVHCDINYKNINIKMSLLENNRMIQQMQHFFICIFYGRHNCTINA